MDVRDAVEADAERLAEMTDSPTDVMRNLVHDRTVRVAETDDGIVGFVSFDARERTVHVTQLESEGGVYDRLLEEPVRFARTERMNVELLVPEDETNTREAAEAAGFDHTGAGPAFEGQSTVRYRLDPR
ncbi:hypothetical protein BRC64_12725 [Halobacteriales archaeon QH_10_67_22]|nr:MAG: hypothetical protein BRC64_12725 [Halobacteriales archaeon QH_10_67_22]